MENDQEKIHKTGTKLSLEDLRKVFDKAGLRLTHQRIMIYNAIMEAKDHPSAEALYERLKKEVPTMSLDTVYRTLATLEYLGLIKRVQVFDYIRFEPDLSRHHHFVCKICKKIIDVKWPQFDSLTLPKEINLLGKVLDHQVEIRGICKECLCKKEETKTT